VTEALGDGLVSELGKELDGVGVRVTPGVAVCAGVIVALGVGVAEWCTTVPPPELPLELPPELPVPPPGCVPPPVLPPPVGTATVKLR
jgi:hypothetical protein